MEVTSMNCRVRPVYLLALLTFLHPLALSGHLRWDSLGTTNEHKLKKIITDLSKKGKMFNLGPWNVCHIQITSKGILNRSWRPLWLLSNKHDCVSHFHASCLNQEKPTIYSTHVNHGYSNWPHSSTNRNNGFHREMQGWYQSNTDYLSPPLPPTFLQLSPTVWWLSFILLAREDRGNLVYTWTQTSECSVYWPAASP